MSQTLPHDQPSDRPLDRPTPLSPLARRLLVGVALSAVGNGLVLPFLMVYLHQVRGIATATAGLVFACMGAVSVAVAPLGGALADRHGPRAVLLGSLVVQATGVALTAWVEEPWQAFGAAVVTATGLAGFWPAQGALLGQLANPGQRQRLFGVQFMLLNLGIGVGGLVAAAVVDVHRPRTFQLLYLLDALSFLGYAAVLLAMPGVGRVALRGERDHAAGGSYRLVLADPVYRRVLVCTLLLITFGYAQIEAGFTAFATQESGVGPRVLGIAFAVNTATIVAGQLLVLRRLDGRSRSGALALAGLTWGVAWVLLGLSGLGSTAVAGAALPVVAMAVYAVGETVWAPVMPTLVNDLAPDALRGRYNAAHSMVWQVSMIIGPALAGVLIGHGHASSWVGLTAGGCALGAVLAAGLRRHLTPAQDGRARSSGARDLVVAGDAVP